MATAILSAEVFADDADSLDAPSFADELWAAAQHPTFDVPPPAEPRIPFSDWLDGEAGYYSSLDSDLGNFVARLLADAAETARFLKAEGPEAYLTRLAIEEAARDARLARLAPCPICDWERGAP